MQIKLAHIARSIILLALTLIITTSAGATDLSGKVIEVVDGNTISLKSLSHTIKVRLLAVAPPAQNQAYADVAKKHLSDLVLGKFVVVRYTGIGEQGYLVGRILLEQGDVNAQMLRDGVAWYNQPEGSDLSPADRELYLACEKAARSEKRGLWQDPSPTAPWEFKKLPTVVTSVSTPVLPRQQSDPFVRAGGQSTLSSDDLSGFVGAGASAGQPNARQLSPNAPPGSWMNYQPADRHFSILVPSNGVEVTRPSSDEHGNQTDVHFVMGSRGGVFCSLSWAEGPNNRYTDALAATDAIQNFMKSLNSELAKKGNGLTASSKEVGSLKVGDYVGKEYNVQVGDISGAVRILTKQTGNKRELLVLTVMNKTADEASASQFLNSLKVNTKPLTDQ